jgi:hypothetical protein
MLCRALLIVLPLAVLSGAGAALAQTPSPLPVPQATPPAGDAELAAFRNSYMSGDGLAYVVITDEKGERIYRYGDASRLTAKRDTRGYMLFTCSSPHVFIPQQPADKAALMKAKVVKSGESGFEQLDAKYLAGCRNPLVKSAIPKSTQTSARKERSGATRLVLSDDERMIVLREIDMRDGSTMGLGSLVEGSDVPRNVEVRVFPDTVVQKVPQLKGYKFFTAEKRIGIVDPNTSKVHLLIDGR